MNKKIIGTLLLSSAFAIGLGVNEEVSANSTFNDISSNHWAYQSVNKMSERGIVRGFEDGTFKPNQEVTRAQSAMFLTRSLGADTSDYSQNPYLDVNNKVNGFAEIIAMYKMGVFAPADNFGPYKELTRSEMAKIIVEAYNLKIDPNGQAFSDVSSSHWANDYILTISNYGITSGIEPGKFGPEQTVSRAQMVAFIDRTEQVIASNPSVIKESVGTEGVVGKSYDKIDINRDYQSSNVEIESEFIRLLNEYRASLGLKMVVQYESLSKFAAFRSWDMVQLDAIGQNHSNYGTFDMMVRAFDKTLKSPTEMIVSTNMNFNPTEAASHALNLWKANSSHNATLTYPGLTKAGLGIKKDAYGNSIVTVALAL